MNMTCDNCGNKVDHAEDRCLSCGECLPVPNVRAAIKPEETAALQKRYNDIVQFAKANGNEHYLRHFEETMKRTCAVINLDFDDLHFLCTKENSIFSSYHLMAKAQVRRAAQEQDSRRRNSVEEIFFPDYGGHIRYAALSFDGSGLVSYGKFTIKLDNFYIEKRASLLEDNSFQFAKKHEIITGEPPPFGYRATWQNRHKLAVAKHGDEINHCSSQRNYGTMILFSDGNRHKDKFIEVHIYGPFDYHAIESVSGGSTVDEESRVRLKKLKEQLKKDGKGWIEV